MKISIKKLVLFIPINILLIFIFVSILTPKSKYSTGKDTVAYFGENYRYQILVTHHGKRKEYCLTDLDTLGEIDRNVTQYIDLKKMKTAFIVGQKSFKEFYIILDYENNKIEKFNDLSEMNTIYRNTFTEKDFNILKTTK